MTISNFYFYCYISFLFIKSFSIMKSTFKKSSKTFYKINWFILCYIFITKIFKFFVYG